RPPADTWALIWRIREVAERSGFDKMAGTATAVIAVQVAAVEGDRATAERYLDEAVRRNHSPGRGTDAVHTARWRVLLALEAGDAGAARCLLALDRTDEARAQAEAAAALLERWPGWRQQEVAALLRRLDPRPAPAAGGDPTALTPREREVAALLAEGLSNAEVARRLYISTKTAAVHVSNILAKLGMGSRAEVAAWAVREGISL